MGGYWVLSTLVVAGAMGAGDVWGQEGVATAPASAAAAGPGKPGEVNLAEDVPLDKVVKEIALVQKALQARDGNGAKKAADEIVANHPTLPEAYLVRAELNGQFQAIADAKKDIDKALELDPNNARANAMSATLIARGGDTTGALEKVNKALAVNPNSASLLAIKADILGSRQDGQGVIDTLKGPAATLKDPQSSAVLNAKLAQAYGVQKKFPEAMAAIERTIKNQPGNPEALVIKAQILEASGDVVGAYDAFVAVKAKPGALAQNAQFMVQLDAKIKELQGKANQIKSAKALEAKSKQDAQELKGIIEGRAKLVAAMEAYQKSPGDEKLRDAAAEMVLALCVKQGESSEAEVIPLHKSEYVKTPVDKAPKEVVEARAKAAKGYADDKSIDVEFFSETPEPTLDKLGELVAIYPSAQLLEMMAKTYFGQNDFIQASRYAALAAGMSALEAYQLPVEPDVDPYFGFGTPAWVFDRRLALQALRFKEGKLTESDQLVADYVQAQRDLQWYTLLEVYQRGAAKMMWYSPKNPIGGFAIARHHTHSEQMEAAALAKGQEALKAGDTEKLKAVIELIGKARFAKQETYEFCIAGQKALGQETAIRLAVSKALEAYPFSPVARLSLGQDFEKQSKPADAMYQYNTGAKGLATADQKGDALDCAKARDRIEQTLGKEMTKSYTGFIDAERAIANLEKQRHAMIYSALTRVLPNHSNKALLNLLRGQEAIALEMFEACIFDMNKAIELNPENVYTAKAFIGDSYYQISRKEGMDKAGKEKLLKQSAEAYGACIDKAPDKANLATLLNARASRYRDLDEPEKALADYTKAAELFDDRVKSKAWAYLELSRLKEKKGDIPGAKADAQKALEMSKISWTGTEKRPAAFADQVSLLAKK
jgi:tetratricopeptide (TPR) repeat protein